MVALVGARRQPWRRRREHRYRAAARLDRRQRLEQIPAAGDREEEEARLTSRLRSQVAAVPAAEAAEKTTWLWSKPAVVAYHSTWTRRR